MGQRLTIGGIDLTARWVNVALFVLILDYYILLARMFHLGGLGNYENGLTFNSLLSHLIRGRLDVDPGAIGDEAFVYHGRSYAYFGILPAILRVPLLIAGRLDVNMTGVSCFLAASIAGFLKIQSAIVAGARCEDVPLRRYGILALIAVFFLGGSELPYLMPSIYQEVVFWADVFASAFVYCVVLGLVVRQEFSERLLATMALLSGLELITRVSTAIGLYGATILLILLQCWRDGGANEILGRPHKNWQKQILTAPRRLLTRRYAGPIAILGLFAILAGAINAARWGNPLAFGPMELNKWYAVIAPERLKLLAHYGMFNPERLWYGLLYYFAPIWVWIRPDGHFLFQDFQQRTINSIEMPMSSLFVTDPLLIAAAVSFFWFGRAAWKQNRLDGPALAVVLIGLAIPAILILGWESMAFRYRMEFQAFLTLTTILAYFFWCSPAAGKLRYSRRISALALGMATAGVTASHLLFAAYVSQPLGDAKQAERSLRDSPRQTQLRSELLRP